MPLKTHIECVCVCPTMCSRCNVHKRERERLNVSVYCMRKGVREKTCETCAS